MLKFLIDNQLPVALAQFLIEHGAIAHHVRDIGLGSSDPVVIERVTNGEKTGIVIEDGEVVS